MIDCIFGEFWKIHPRPKYHDACRELFRKAVQAGEDAEKIVSAAQLYAREQAGNKAKGNVAFICQSDNWLKKRAWRDDPSSGQQDASPSEIASVQQGEGPVDAVDFWAGAIRDGVHIPSTAVTPSMAREMLRRGLVTPEQLQKCQVWV